MIRKTLVLLAMLAVTAYAAAPPLLPRPIADTDRVPVVNTGTSNAYTVSPDQIADHTVKKKFGNYSALSKFGANENGPTFNGQPVGQQGPAGPTGPQGDPGATGPAGPQGPQGPTGLFNLRAAWQGAPTGYVYGDEVSYNGSSYVALAFSSGVVPGTDATKWDVVGKKGDTGATGPQGPQGIQGTKGDTGATGPQGPQGVQGVQGPQGPQGVAGSTGATGATGATGPAGAQGPKGDKGDAGTTAFSGLSGTPADNTALQGALDLKLNATTPSFTGDLTTTNPDGTHYSWDYNTTACPTTNVQEGAKCTLPSGIWWYRSGAWTQSGLVPSYTLPTAGPSTLGGVKTGSTLTIANGVLDVMVSSLGPSGLVTAGLAGDQTISSGFAYVATATPWKATFNSYTSTKQTTVFANYSGTLCAASGSKLYWPNPVTFVNNSGACAKLRAGTRATVQMLGGKTFATATQNLQKASIPMASVSPTSLAFGSVVAGSTSSPLTATLTNSGLTNLVTGTPTISGTDAAKFAISSNGCSAATLAPAATCTESVTFTPSAAGSYSAQLNIPHNAAGSPTVVAITGAGISSAALISEDFETGALPSGWSNNLAVFGVTPAISGNYSMSVVNGQYVTSSTFAAQSDIYLSALVKVSGVLPSANGILRTADAAGNPLGIVSIRSTGKVQVGSVQSAGAVIVLDTPVYLKMRATAGTGANAVVSVWSSATGLAGSWTLQATDSAGTWTASAVKALIKSTAGESTALHTVDRFRISATDINY